MAKQTSRRVEIENRRVADKALFSKSSRQQAKVDVIVRAAARLIYERGVADTSLDDVAEALGIAKPSLYYYVKNKEELIFLCNQRIFDLKEEALAAAEAEGRTGADKLARFLTALVKIVLDPESGMPRLWQAGPQSILTGKRRKDIDRITQAQSERIRGIIREGMSDGSLHAQDAALAEAAMLGAVYWIPVSHLFDADADADAVADAYVTMLFHGLDPRSRADKR